MEEFYEFAHTEDFARSEAERLKAYEADIKKKVEEFARSLKSK